MNFAERLKKGMDYRQVSQVELARKTDISRSSICLYLKGERIPKTEQIYRIALALDIDFMYLIGESDSMIKQSFKVHQGLFEPTEEELLLSEIRSNMTWLTKEEMRMLNEMIKTIIKGRK